MKKKPGFNMLSVCGEKVIMAEGIDNMDFNKLLSLNETAAFLWEAMGEGEFTIDELVGKLTAEYEVSDAQARENVEQFVAELQKVGVMEG